MPARRSGAPRFARPPDRSRAARALSPTSRAPDLGELAEPRLDRLLARRGPRASSSARPRGAAPGARRSSSARTPSASLGERSPTDCSSSTARNSPGSNVAARSVRRRSTRSSSAPLGPRGVGRRQRLARASPVNSKRAAVSFQAACRSLRVTSTFALRFSSFRRRSSPRSGSRPHFARKRSAALATSRLRAENASDSPRGTPAISK